MAEWEVVLQLKRSREAYWGRWLKKKWRGEKGGSIWAFIIYLFIFGHLCSAWDISSPTRIGTCAPCPERADSTTRETLEGDFLRRNHEKQVHEEQMSPEADPWMSQAGRTSYVKSPELRKNFKCSWNKQNTRLFSITLVVPPLSRAQFSYPHRRQPTRLPRPWDSPGKNMEWVAISFSNAWKWKVKVKSLSCVWLFATPRTAAHQAPPPMGFSRQEYWSGVPLPFPPVDVTPEQNSEMGFLNVSQR